MSDLISRQSAIDDLKDMYEAAEKWKCEVTDEVIKARAESCMASLVEMKLRIEKLPSAQPEPITVNIDHELTQEEYEKLRKDMANAPIMLLPAAQPEQRWIPCSERLPEGGREILVTEKGGFIRHCEYANYGDFQEFQTIEEGLTVHDVIAWMPLPEPYKGEES